MQQKHVPAMDKKYWSALILASIFGCNTGDFVADTLGLGHVSGLPILAVLLALVLVAERFDRFRHAAYFWAGIIVVRTAATNIGDIAFDLRLTRPLVIACLAVLLFAIALAWHLYNRNRYGDDESLGGRSIATFPIYWVEMLVAGALGTVFGDFCSFNLMGFILGRPSGAHVGAALGGEGAQTGAFISGIGMQNLYAALILALPLAVLFVIGHKKRIQTRLFYYWLTVVFIRSAGTAFGDFVAHTPLHLEYATLATGLVFVLFLLFWPGERRGSGAAGPAPIEGASPIG
jgi:uncharacterized membrane-anchored protein